MAINPAEITTIRVGELPIGTITATSKIAIENGTDLQQITGQDLIDFININSNAFQFEEKTLHVNQTYIDENFDNTGLGINLMVGWAICNGQNGTPPMDGLVNIGYGTNYNVINAYGGSKDAVVVSHSHNVVVSGGGAGDGFATFNDGNGTGKSYTTQTTGVSGTNRNMQPYKVSLKIMKL
jgi:hypothetical protein